MIDLNKGAGVLVKTTLVDFPGHVACAFFLKGCNLRCPYCYNTGLVLNTDAHDENLTSLSALFEHLVKRRRVLDGIAISGGEPLINPATKEIIKTAKSLGYKIKIDTNGLLPERLEELISSEETKPDFIAMDIKTSPDRYCTELLARKVINEKNHMVNQLKKSIELISAYPSDCREFRTVLVPPLIQADDIKAIASVLPKDASWQFAQFRNEGCINPAYNEILPYTDRQINELITIAKSQIPGAALR